MLAWLQCYTCRMQAQHGIAHKCCLVMSDCCCACDAMPSAVTFLLKSRNLPEIGPVEAGAEGDAVTQAQLLHHIMLYTRCGCCSQRQQWHLWVPAKKCQPVKYEIIQ